MFYVLFTSVEDKLVVYDNPFHTKEQAEDFMGQVAFDDRHPFILQEPEQQLSEDDKLWVRKTLRTMRKATKQLAAISDREVRSQMDATMCEAFIEMYKIRGVEAK